MINSYSLTIKRSKESQEDKGKSFRERRKILYFVLLEKVLPKAASFYFLLGTLLSERAFRINFCTPSKPNNNMKLISLI